jgi:hypothetical protein
MASRTWVGASGGAWTTTTNWSPSGAPTSSDDLTINGFSGTINITNGNARHIYIEGGSNVTFATGTSTLSVNGDLLVNNGTLYTTGTNSNSIQFLGTAQASNWSPGGGTYARVQVAKSTSSCNINGSPTITGQFTFVNGTINQNAAITTAIVVNSGANARTWNMNGYDVTVTNTTGTPYSQSTSACTFGGTRGYFIMQGGATAACGTNEASAPSIKTAYAATVTITGHIFNLELNGAVSGANTVTAWGTFYDYATANSTSTSLSLARSAGGTYTYSSYHQWSTILFGQSGTAVTWNITSSRANSITCGGSGYTYTLSDCTFSTNNTSGLINLNCSNSTVNINDIYSSQGTSTQLQMSGSGNTFNLANTGGGTQVINGSLSFIGANTLNVIDDFSCYRVSISGVQNKTINFSNSWIIVNQRSAGGGTVTISDPAYLFTDMASTITGGFIVRNSSTAAASVFSTVARDHCPRVRWESSTGSTTGQVREFIIQNNCGFNTSSTITLMVGDIVDEGTIIGLSNLSVELGHGVAFNWDSRDRFNSGGYFAALTVSSVAASGVEYGFRANCVNVTNARTSATIRYNDVYVTGTATASVSATYYIDNLVGLTNTSTQLSLAGASSTIYLGNISLTGNLSYIAANATTTLTGNDVQCRGFSHSGVTNKTLNFNDRWIYSYTTGSNTSSISISDSTYLFTDMSTTSTGGFRYAHNVSNSTVALGTMARAHAPRIRIEGTAGSIAGNVREVIVASNCGPGQAAAAGNVTLMVGGYTFEGTLNVALLYYLYTDLGHDFNYDFNYISEFNNYGLRFGVIGVSTQYTGTVADISAACNSLTLNSKTGITININNVKCNNVATLSVNNTYNLYQLECTDNTSTQLTLSGNNATFNLYNVTVYGNVSFFASGGTLNLNDYDLNCRGFSHSGVTNKTINPNGRWIISNDRGTNQGVVSIADPTYLLSNWTTTGYIIRSTGTHAFGAVGLGYIPNIRVEAPTGSSNYLPNSLGGRVKDVYFDNVGGSTIGQLYSGTTNIYGNVTGNVTTTQTSWTISIEANCTFSATSNNSRFYLNSTTVNGSGITVNFNSGFDTLSFNQTLGWSNINANSLVRQVATTGGLTHTAGTIDISPGVTLQAYSFVRSGTSSASLILDGDLECPTQTSTSTRFNVPDTTNYTVSGNGWVIYRGAGLFNYGGTNSSAINFTTGANTFNVKILQNISSTSTGTLTLPAAKSFTNHEGTWDQMGRWAANTTSFNMYIFGDFSVYAPPNDDGTYRNKAALIQPIFAGTDNTKIHNFGNTSINPGYGGMEPSFSGIKMMSAGTLRCLHNVNCAGTVFQHGAGTVELTSSNINCTTVFFHSDGVSSALDSGTRNWVFPSPNTHFICNTNFSHAVTTGLTCSGTYYNANDPTQLSGVYCDFTSGALRSGSTTSTTTPPNFILPNTSTKPISPFYCNGIRLASNNLTANDSIYVYGMWAPTNQSGTNVAWPSGINIYMIGTNNGYIDTTGDTASCPITIVDPGVGNTKIVYTSARTSQTTRIGTITVNTRTTLSGNPIPANAASNVVVSELLTLLGSWTIKSGQGWDFSGSGSVLSAATSENITDAGGIIYFSNSAATQAIFPATTINNITRNTTSTNALTITSNNTNITTIANHASGGGSFAFVDGGSGAPTFSNFNIDGQPSAITLITGPVISSGSTFLVDYATITNSTASPSGKWLGGNGTTDGGGNTNWLFGQGVNNNDNFFLILF